MDRVIQERRVSGDLGSEAESKSHGEPLVKESGRGDPHAGAEIPNIKFEF